MDTQLCEKKKISQCNGTRILPGKCQSTVRVFFDRLQQQKWYSYLYIDLYMIFWFYFTCIKISPRQDYLVTFSSVYFEPDVTCSYDVIMRK